jgi:hypothetical protein
MPANNVYVGLVGMALGEEANEATHQRSVAGLCDEACIRKVSH